MPQTLDRRSFLHRGLLGLGAVGLAVAWPIHPPAYGEPTTSALAGNCLLDTADPNAFVFPRLRYASTGSGNGKWNANPGGDDMLLDYLKKVTTIKVSTKTWEQRVIGIDDLTKAFCGENPKVYSLPFLFMTGLYDFQFSPDEGKTLREYMRRGLFFYVDDCQGTDCSLYKAFVRELPKIVPDGEMKPLALDHEIYHCFFDLPRGAPSTYGDTRPDLALYLNDRLSIFLTAGDLHCGWAQHYLGGGGVDSRIAEDCCRMGVNIIFYALTH
jgi:hypothetical protein